MEKINGSRFNYNFGSGPCCFFKLAFYEAEEKTGADESAGTSATIASPRSTATATASCLAGRRAAIRAAS